MKRFLKNSLLFLLVFFVVDKGFYYFLIKAPEREYDTRLEQILEGKINKDIIILGSSRGADNILAGQIEKVTGQSTYNLSYPGSDITFHNFIFKSLLKFNKKPKMIILAIDNPFEFRFESTLVFRLDRLYPLSKYNYINQELILQKQKNLLSKFFCLARINRSNFSFKNIPMSLQNPIDNWGSMPFENKSKNIKINYNYSNKEYDSGTEINTKLEAFRAIQIGCKEKNIDLIYVFAPSFGEFNTAFYNRFLKEVQKKNVMVYDSLNPVYKDPAYFYDESHLLETGAKIYTDEIITFIKNKNQTK
ncbi:hypothetical protein [Flavobacterium sp. 7A]|uniref:hypothetical protein n=1 Tax=Flavobacterium sp. 7A TaxID=2940571 RepID=UPI002227AA65|nr:hypothetical protein [Flavobacterium sp. 7A]MCW2119445.1 hypothetical protein [Flavobacterium sp. 7A]